MKYVLMFVGTAEDQEGFERLSREELAAQLERVGGWFQRYGSAGKVVATERLQGPETVTTVRSHAGKRMVTDGPFMESKEVVGGFAVVDVKDLDEALEMAKEWPAGPVEVWPVMQMQMP